MALITFGSIHAAEAPNVIPDEATLKADIRAYSRSWMEEMALDTVSDGFSNLALEGVPYAYWNFGSEDHNVWEEAKRNGTLNELPGNHSAFYAPVIEPTLKAGVDDAMGITALTFLRLGENEKLNASNSL